MFERFFRDRWVRKLYVSAGGDFGDAVSMIYMGECVNMEQLLNRWAKWERHFAARGYRTISLDEFVEHGGYSQPLAGLGILGLGIRRDSGEQPVFHAEIYREVYLGKIVPVVDINALMLPGAEPQFRSYVLPSTAALASRSKKK